MYEIFTNREIYYITNDIFNMLSQIEKQMLDSQNSYIKNHFNKDLAYSKKIYELLETKQQMKQETKMVIWIPVYNDRNIEETINSYTLKQKCVTEDLYELLILVNTPNNDLEYNSKILENISLFKTEAPQYSLVDVYNKFDFKENVYMWEVYKMLWDLILARNIQRWEKETSDKETIEKTAANLIMRLGGSDSTRKNPNFVKMILDTFESTPHLMRLTSESRINPEITKNYPLLHILEFMENSLNRVRTQGKHNSSIGNGSFRAGIYAEIGGHNPTLISREDIDITTKIKDLIKNTPWYKEKHLSYKNAIDNSMDRWIHAIINGISFFDRYNQSFEVGDKTKEIRREKYILENECFEGKENLLLNHKNLEKAANELFWRIIKRVETCSATYKDFLVNTQDTHRKQQFLFEFSTKIFRKSFCGFWSPLKKFYNIKEIGLDADGKIIEQEYISLSTQIIEYLTAEFKKKKFLWVEGR